MAVCTKYHVSGLHITSFRHQLMTDSVTSMYIFHSKFLCKLISHMEMSGIVQLTGRNQMIIDQHDFIRIPKLCKSHLFELLCNKRNENIVDHHSVHIYSHDISRFYRFSHIISDNLLNNCLAHLLLPSS